MDFGLYKKYVKRILDFVLSIMTLIILSPVLAIIAVLVKVRLGSPVVFKQARPGKNEKIFYLYKFRSMTNETDKDGKLLPDAQRLTKFGKFLRASSLDELLELINIIKGDMSIVGPRPLSIYYLPYYDREQQRRHEVRPGLTGLAQIHGRNNLPWDDRFEMDIDYVNHITFWGDVKIICETFLKVLKGEDVSVRGSTKDNDFGPYSVLKEQGVGGKKEGKKTFSEIGGYFWLCGNEKIEQKQEISWLPIVDDSAFTISGRMALDLVLKDILRDCKIDRAYVPSYCCVSMLQPFLDRGIKIEFYTIDYIKNKFNYHLPEIGPCSVFLIMNYFGISYDDTRETIKKAHDKGALIIEDISHSLLNELCGSEMSDYFVASFREWFPVASGGWTGKKKGRLVAKPMLDSNHTVIDKIEAMKEEYSYLTGKISSKDHFLLEQAKFENDLIHIGKMMKIDDLSMSILASTNIKEVIKKRCHNAGYLIRELKNLDGKICTLPNVDLNTEVPIFLPIFLEEEKRDSLKSYLADKGIYCPIHWNEKMGAPACVRQNELSLVCDQRYGEGDMKAIVDEIYKWSAVQLDYEY